jgi:hypothetical protein
MARYEAVLEQPLTRSLCDRWLKERSAWFDTRVEAPVRAFDPDGMWRGRMATPTPRRWSVRVTDWASFESSRTGHSVRGSELFATRSATALPPQVHKAATELQAWRKQGRIALGPFAEPDSQDAFQIFITRGLL